MTFRREDEGTDGDEPSAPPRGSVRPRPIGLFLFLLVAVILVPALTFSVVLLERNHRAQRELIDTLAGATASSISEAVDREILGMVTTLRVLSTAESLPRGEYARFHDRARSALAGKGAYVILVDNDMRQLLNTRVTFGTPLEGTSDTASVQRALETGVAVVSNAFFGRTAQRWVFNVVLPLTAAGLPGKSLIMTQDATNLSQALSQQALRGGWEASLIDQNGVVLASSQLPAETGKPFFLGGYPASGQYEGRVDENADSAEYSLVTEKSPLTGWTVGVWAPSAVIDGPLWRSMLSLALGALGVGLLAAIAAWLLGRQIAGPVKRLARDAKRLGKGEEVAAVDYPIAEIATVSEALAQASTDRRAAENEIRFLMREVAHRSKNQLTVVSSIAKQSARSARNLTAFQDSFQKRLQGLARSTDLLVAGGVAGVELRALLATQIEPFRPPEEERMELDGPALRLGNQAAQTIGLAVHELATNAAKYGAFSGSAGRLSVAWCIADGRLALVWREYVPRLRRRAETRGFGTEVIERMLGGTLDASIERIIHPDGLECRFSIPLDRLRPAAEAMPGG